MGVIILGSNASWDTCEYCGVKGEELRPYGHNNKWICFDCAMKPENKAVADANLNKFLVGELGIDDNNKKQSNE